MRQGFTLLELSIVLVIIGLIIGGITVGQELIRSAERNALLSDISKIKTAINSFKLKYNALPGDMDNASSYWPTCDATPANCNGDGDGVLDTQAEAKRAWQQLADSEIYSGSFAGTGNYEAGVTMPQGRFNSYYILSSADTIASGPLSPVNGNDALLIGLSSAGYVVASFEYADDLDATATLEVEDAYSIDIKTDDGIASTGQFFAAYCNNQPYGLDEDVAPGAANWDYDLTSANKCQTVFFID